MSKLNKAVLVLATAGLVLGIPTFGLLALVMAGAYPVVSVLLSMTSAGCFVGSIINLMTLEAA